MNDNHYEQKDDKVVEISNLPHEEASEERKAFPFEKRLLSFVRWSHQHRRVSVLGTSSLLCLALLIFLGSILPLQQLRSGKGLGPAPTPMPLSGSDLFYFSPLPSWGTVFLDGQPLTLTPVPIVSNKPPIRLPAGRHLLEWQAAPFIPQHCVLLVPPRQSAEQTCRVTQAPTTTFADSSSLVTIPVSLAQLPIHEHDALIQATQSLLDTLQSTETVQPGEHYTLTENPEQIMTATAPLQATLRLSLDTDISAPANCIGLSLGEGCTIAGQDCHLFCTPLWPKTPGAGWDIAALFHTTWQYSDMDGYPVKNSLSLHSASGPIEQFVVLHVTWTQGQWHVAFQSLVASSFDDPICVATIGLVGANPTYQSLPGSTTLLQWAYASASRTAAGCLAIARLEQSPSLSSTPTGDALLLRRFGVLLAANPTAYQVWPSLPTADSYEQQLAQDLVSRAIW